MNRWGQKQTGFTIVELLIVIVVIGILAAITIVAYTNIQTRAKVNRANSEMASLQRGMLAYKATTGELPPLGDAWNYDTNPPSCSTLDYVEAAFRSSGVANSMSKVDPWGSCWGV